MATIITGTTGADIVSTPERYNSSDSTFAFFGDFGTGGTLTIEASYDDGTTFIPVNDPSRTVIEITANEIINLKLGKCLIQYRIAGTTLDPTVTVVIKD